MVLEDAFCFYPGDYTLLYAVTLELMVRKLLHENGYDQKTFRAHIDMSVPLKSGNNVHPSENVAQAIEFIEKALTFMGCRVRCLGREFGPTIVVRLPRDIFLLSNNRDEVIGQLNQGWFDSWNYEVKLGKRNTVFYLFDDEFGNDWRCLVDIVRGIIKLCKGGLAYGSVDKVA